jgi:microsomal dipeptidase-like Zn-dependent dipeptidase
MKKRALPRWLIISAAIAALWLVLRELALVVQSRLNRIVTGPPYKVRGTTADLHSRLLIADLHADPLLWRTDLLHGHSIGHVDLPRLQRANIALQVFGVVTKVPRPERDAVFAHGADLITLLSAVELWPLPAWFSPSRRALYQARKLRRLERRAAGEFTIVTSGKGLADFLARRATDAHLVAGLLALEGAHALQGNLEQVELLYDAGFRMVGLTHLFDNEAGGSSLGAAQYGLTAYGRELMKLLEDKKIIIDLAHASPALFADLLSMTTRPLLVSHTGVQGVCPNPRNLSDRQIRQVAERGGLIGIGFDALFTCTLGVKPIADSIRYVAERVGTEHVALGSDFDGAVHPPFDVTGLPLLTEELVDQGFAESELAKIMGGNAIRFLIENLP